MTVYVALLRGVNVGGRSLKMDALRAASEACGFTSVQTYLQSGNVVFTSRKRAASAAEALYDAVFEATSIDSRVVIRTAAELADVVAHNPFDAAAAADPTKVSVCFLFAPVAPTLDAVDPSAYAPDEVVVRGAQAYLHTPNGMGRSKLVEPMMKRLGITGTVRNWRTTTALAKLAAGLG